MAEKKFKRKRKPSKKQTTPAALKLISTRSNEAAPAYQTAPNTGLNYAAGPLYGLAATAEAWDYDAIEPQQDRSDLPANDSSASEEEPTLRILRNPSRGQPLDAPLRRKMEQRFGHSFKNVELHSGPVAQQVTRGLQATAFTHRQHIWLGSRTNSTDAKVIAHELTHVVQQGQAPPQSRSAISLGNIPSSRPNPMHSVNSSAAVTSSQGASAIVQRLDIWDSALSLGGRAISAVRGGARYVRNAAGELIEAGTDYFVGLAEEWAPGLVAFLRSDIITVIKEKIVSCCHPF